MHGTPRPRAGGRPGVRAVVQSASFSATHAAMYDAILQALRRGDAGQALTDAQLLAQQQPGDARAHQLVASALRATGDEAGAMAAIERALEMSPDDADLHLARAGLLIGARKLDDAQAALARSTGLDPNQFPAYVVQAQLALGRGDLDDAERLMRTAARIAPEHPHVAAIEGTLALRRGDADAALAILSRAAERAPGDLQLRHALAFAYLAKGHFAFAEAALRALLEANESDPLRALLADVVRRQGRAEDAAELLAPLAARDAVPPALHRLLGEIELDAQRPERALAHLRTALAAAPHDRRTLVAIVEAWRRLGDVEDARNTLDAALATHVQAPDLWRARLAFEPFADGGAREVVERWRAAMPDHIPALEAMVAVHDVAGEDDANEALVRRIVELEPGHAQAELRLLDLILRRDPDAAIARVRSLIAQAQDPGARRMLRGLLGRTLDVAGRVDEAVAEWAALQAEVAHERLPLPPLSGAPSPLPAQGAVAADAPGTLLLWGAPGSLVERIAATFEVGGAPLRADRYGTNPPPDGFQRYESAAELVDGRVSADMFVAQWRAQLAARQAADGSLVDWLIWWDNAFAVALRAQLPEALLMVALRDPRDMLLDWLAWGAPAPLAIESPVAAATWLAAQLEQLADLIDCNFVPHRVIRLDALADDPQGLAAAMSDALDAPIPPAPAQALGPARFAPGRWRAYAAPLREAFATLTPVARRLGYPDA